VTGRGRSSQGGVHSEEFTGYPPCATGYPPCATSSVTALPFPIPPQGALGLSSGAATTECEPSTLERVCARTRLVAFKVWETLGPGARLIRRHPVPKSYPRSPPRFGFPTFPDSACSILSFCREVLYYSFVSLKSGYYMRSRASCGAHGALRSCMNISTAYSHFVTKADSRHSSTTSVIPYLHGAIPMPIALLCAACTAATAPSPMRSPLPTEHKVAPLTHHFTDGQFCDHTRRRPISGQRKHASRSRSRPKSHSRASPHP
jgi:hypothetical protein